MIDKIVTRVDQVHGRCLDCLEVSLAIYVKQVREKKKKKNRVCMCLEVLLLCVHLVLGGLDSRVEAEFNGLLILNTMNVTQTSLYILDHITNTSFS